MRLSKKNLLATLFTSSFQAVNGGPKPSSLLQRRGRTDLDMAASLEDIFLINGAEENTAAQD